MLKGTIIINIQDYLHILFKKWNYSHGNFNYFSIMLLCRPWKTQWTFLPYFHHVILYFIINPLHFVALAVLLKFITITTASIVKPENLCLMLHNNNLMHLTFYFSLNVTESFSCWRTVTNIPTNIAPKNCKFTLWSLSRCLFTANFNHMALILNVWPKSMNFVNKSELRNACLILNPVDMPLIASDSWYIVWPMYINLYCSGIENFKSLSIIWK